MSVLTRTRHRLVGPAARTQVGAEAPSKTPEGELGGVLGGVLAGLFLLGFLAVRGR